MRAPGRTLGGIHNVAFGRASDAEGSSAVLIASVIEEAGYTVRGAFSRSVRLFDDYAGALVTVRRASDNTTLAIGCATGTDDLDVAALAAFCGASSGFVVTCHNQDGSGNDITHPTTTRQPKIYDGTTGTVLIGTLPVMEHASSANTDADHLRANTHQLGFTGSPSITVYASAAFSDVSTYRRSWCGVGGVGNTSGSFALGFGETGNLGVSINRLGLSATAGRREFTAATPVSSFSFVIAQSAGGASSNTTVVSQNGVLLAESTSLHVQRTTLSGNVTSLGGIPSGGDTFGCDGQTSTEIWIEGVVTGAALEALAAFGDSQLTAAGVTPVAHDLTDAVPFITLPAGQSNCEGIPAPAVPPVDYGPHWLTKVAAGGTALDPYWIPGGVRYLLLRDAIIAAPTDVPLVVWWVQGESDSGNSALSAAYLANMQSIYTNLLADTGRTFYWLDTLLHSDNAATYRATVNTSKNAFVAWVGSSAAIIDPTAHGSLEDGVHWNPALDTAMPSVAIAAARAAWF